MPTSTLLVTLRGPLKTVDLELPADVPVGELIPLLLEICGPRKNDSQELLQAPISLQVEGTVMPLSPEKTLIDADVCDGVVLVLQRNDASSAREESFEPRLFVPRSVQPSPETGGIGVTWKVLG